MQLMATKLQAYRKEIGLTQRAFATEAKMSFQTYRNIEQGRDTTYTTAKHILGTLNRLRGDRDLLPVTLDNLGINIV